MARVRKAPAVVELRDENIVHAGRAEGEGPKIPGLGVGLGALHDKKVGVRSRRAGPLVLDLLAGVVLPHLDLGAAVDGAGAIQDGRALVVGQPRARGRPLEDRPSARAGQRAIGVIQERVGGPGAVEVEQLVRAGLEEDVHTAANRVPPIVVWLVEANESTHRHVRFRDPGEVVGEKHVGVLMVGEGRVLDAASIDGAVVGKRDV